MPFAVALSQVGMKISAMMMNGRTNNTKSNMNKNVVLVFTTMALLLSCSREVDQVIQPGETITFTAGWAGAKDTRTILQPDGTSVWWEPSAQINVFFSDKASGKFTSTNSQAQGIVDFKGSLPIIVGSVETGNPAHAYWAVYPYDSANTCDGESVTLTIPSIQTASEGTFANKMFPSIATSTNFYLAFYNICGGVRFTVANEGISSVTFKANNGESLVGKVQVGFGNDGKPSINTVIDGSSTVTVNAPEGGFVPGVYYFAAFLPGALSKGLSMTFLRSTSSATYALENTVTINRSRFGTLENKDSDLDFGGIVEVSSISLDRSSAIVRRGETVKLVATVLPENATDKTVEWNSSDETIVAVDQNGNVTGIKEGKATITATAGGKYITCSISVTPADFQPNGNYLAFEGLIDGSTIAYTCSENCLEYSYDTINWVEWRKEGNESLKVGLNTGTKVYVRCSPTSTHKRIQFKMHGLIGASGNVMSLLYCDDFGDKYCIDYSLSGLFEDCTSLTTAPDLPATTLTAGCYGGMFYGCTNLTKAPDLPATTLTAGCYGGMFRGCTSLVQAPDLPATSLPMRCYGDMFEGCSSLSLAPAILATNVGESSCEYMFMNCTSLTKAPNLPAVSLGAKCYQGMFSGCTSLTEAPQLPATTMALECYQGMFSGCTSLTKAPQLPATTLANGCYKWMFQGCSITKAPVLPATTLAANCYESMFSFSSLIQAPNLPATELAKECYKEMFRYCTSLTIAPDLPAEVVYESCYAGMFSECSSLIKAPSVLPALTLSNSCYNQMFYNCENLINAPELPATAIAPSCYSSMFFRCTSLTNAPSILPATTLEDACYSYMFEYCRSLTIAPSISATSTANRCCECMFDGCTSLTQAPPIIPAKTLASRCYYQMFSRCTSLITAPELPATTLADYCYCEMFMDCTSLNSAHDLPATALAKRCCSGMFSGCTSLTKAPELPATTLAERCYQNMFSGCTSLNTAPVLPSPELESRCYYYMFSGCSSLSYVKMMAINPCDLEPFGDWLKGVSSKGTFVKHASAYWIDESKIPPGWTLITATE